MFNAQFSGDIDRSGTCPICLVSLSAHGLGSQSLSCGHLLHEHCVMAMRRFGSSQLCPVCRSPSEELTPIQKLLDRAVLATQRGSPQTSFQLLTEVLSIDASNGPANWVLGQMFHLGDGVEVDYERAAEHYELAHLQGEFPNVSDFGTVGTLREDQKVANNLGEVYKLLGKMKEAEQLFLEAHRSGDSSGTFNLALLQDERGNRKEATELYWKSYRNKKGGCGEAAFNLGNRYMQAGRFREAAIMFKEAMRMGYGRAFNTRVIALIKDGASMELPAAIWHGAMMGMHMEASGLLRHIQDCGMDGGIPSGSSVRIHGLQSDMGHALNGEEGVVWAYDRKSERFCVGLSSSGTQKLFLRRNLDVISIYRMVDKEKLAFWDHLPRLALTRMAEEQGFAEDMASVEGLASANSQIAEVAREAATNDAPLMQAMLRLQQDVDPHTVVVLKYSRNPSAFHDVLEIHPDLADCRQQLERNCFRLRAPGGAYMFVRPDQHESVLEYVQNHVSEFGPNHVIVSEELEDVVRECVASLPRKMKILMQNRDLFMAAVRSDDPAERFQAMVAERLHKDVLDLVVVKRTFIQIQISSSLYSAPSGGRRTSSTTDAEPRSGSNPRSFIKSK